MKTKTTELQRKAAAVIALAEIRGKELSHATVKLFVATLTELTADQVERAVLKAMATGGPHFESPKDILQLAGMMTPEARALQAWEIAIEAMHYVGGYRSPAFEDHRITATIRSLGGWPAFCWNDDEPKWLRQRFLKTYEVFCGRELGDEDKAPLIGECERVNSHLGYEVPAALQVACGKEPMRIGRVAQQALARVPNKENDE